MRCIVGVRLDVTLATPIEEEDAADEPIFISARRQAMNVVNKTAIIGTNVRWSTCAFSASGTL